MNLLSDVYLNFYSIGAFILIAFSLSFAVFYLSIPEKSRATFHIGMASLFMAAYYMFMLAVFSTYNPLINNARLLAALSVLLSGTHTNIFITYFPDEQNPKAARNLLIIQYGFIIVAMVSYLYHTLSTGRFFFFEGHVWDFISGRFLFLGDAIILLINLIGVCLIVWRIIQTRGRVGRRILILGIIWAIAAIVSTVLYLTAREGWVNRDTFQLYLVLTHITFFFITNILYINWSNERTTFMGRIVGISLAAFLLIFQIVNYVILREREDAYNMLRQKEMKLASSGAEPSPDIQYLASWSPQTSRLKVLAGESKSEPEFPLQKEEYLNTIMYEKIRTLPDEHFEARLRVLLEQGNPFFAGYKEAIRRYMASLPPEARDKAHLVLGHIDGLKGFLGDQLGVISQMPDDTFRTSLKSHLAKSDLKFGHSGTPFPPGWNVLPGKAGL